MSWIVDASVAAKWLFEEDLTDRARELLASPGELLAPELVLLEVGSVAWKRVARGETSAEHARAAAAALPRLFSLLVPVAEMYERALGLALELGHPIYDCTYLALAEARRLPLVTADRRLAERLYPTPWKSRVRYLGEL